MVFDPVRGVAVKFAGSTSTYPPVTIMPPTSSTSTPNAKRLKDLWEWNGLLWVQKFPATVPTVREGHARAFDSVRGKAMFCGGGDANGLVPFGVATRIFEMIDYDGTDCVITNFSAQGVKPLGMIGGIGVFDPNRTDASGRFLFIAGWSGTAFLNTTHAWNVATLTWASITTTGTQKPVARGFCASCVDTVRGKIVVHGGMNYNGTTGGVLNGNNGGSPGTAGARTYTLPLNGTAWDTFTPATDMPARACHAMAFDTVNGLGLAFGGLDISFVKMADSWKWDGTTWAELTTAHAPSARYGHSMCYDSVRGVIVLYGGYNAKGELRDTWEINLSDATPDWVQVSTDPAPAGSLTMPTDMVIREAACGDKFTLALADYAWGCGNISQMMISLLDANSHRARPVAGQHRSPNCGGDTILEVFSTYYQKWILIFTQHGGYVVGADGVPKNYAEVLAHHEAGDYSIVLCYVPGLPVRSFKAVAENGSGLQFLPRPECTVLQPPYSTDSKWWSDRLLAVSPLTHDLFDWAKVSQLYKINSDPQTANYKSIGDDSRVSACAGYSALTHYAPDAETIGYALNSIAASARIVGNYVEITLTENLSEDPDGFDHYDQKIDAGAWAMLSLTALGGGKYKWTPAGTSTIYLRGVGGSGIQSNDVEILFDSGDAFVQGYKRPHARGPHGRGGRR